MPPKFGAAKVLCPVCEQRVYPMEAVNFEGSSYHKTCMKCTHCNKKVSIKGLAVINGQLYCKPHFVELFKSGGGRYENFGSSDNLTLLDKPTPETEPPAKPTPNATFAPKKADEGGGGGVKSKLAGLGGAVKSKFGLRSSGGSKESNSTTNAAASIFESIQAKDLEGVKKTIESKGVTTIFEKGTGGMTPIEYAFKNSSDECGRYMIQYLQGKVK